MTYENKRILMKKKQEWVIIEITDGGAMVGLEKLV